MRMLSGESSVLDAIPFPLPDERIVLIDLNGTINRFDSSLGHPEIYRAIQAAQDAKWLIGLNSNKTLKVLRFWRYCLDIRGPLIAEGGAIVDWGGEVYYTTPRVQTVAGRYANASAAARQSFRSQHIVVRNNSDPMRALAENRIRNVRNPGDTLSVFDSSRKLGMSVFVRVVNDEGRLEQRADATNRVAKCLGPFVLGEPMLQHDVSLVGDTQRLTTKRDGAMAFRSMAGVTGRIAMIGNAAEDDIGSDIAVHYAVGDARGLDADHTASSFNTAGVVEILGRLAAVPPSKLLKY